MIWTIGGTVFLIVLGLILRLVGIEYDLQKQEAAYRKILVIAEDDGNVRPKTIDELFDDVRKIHFLSYLRYLYFNIGRIAYLQANVLSAYVFLAPAIVAGVVTLGVMQQIIRAFGRVEGSMQYLLKAWPTIIELASVYKRLREFETKINQEDLVDEKNLMAIDKNFVDQFIKVTSKAALSSSYLVGKKDKIAADKAAVDSMRSELNKMNIQGKIVIGEGELDEAPMLFIGEKVGNKNGPELDIAVDPLEGTNFAANNLPGALSVIAISEKNNLFNAPETYMEKISTRVTEKNIIDLDYSVKKNITNLSDYLNKNPENITACILDRPRHLK